MINLEFLVLGRLENNTFVLTDEETGEIAVIDPSCESDELVSLIEQKGGNLKYILLTHGHFDHIGGVAYLLERYNPQVCISKDEMQLLNDNMLNGATIHHMSVNEVKVDVELSDGDVLKLGDNEIKFITTPGHTAGSGCYIVGEWLFSGDTLFCMSIGRTDFPTSNHQQMLRSLQKLKSLEGEYVVYPGHDRFSMLAAEKIYNPYVK